MYNKLSIIAYVADKADRGGVSVPYGYNNHNYRGYGGYRPSKYNRNRKKGGILSRRMRNRIIIVATGLVVLALIIALISSCINCVFSSGDEGSTLDTATKSTATATEKPTEKKVVEISFREPNIKDNKKAKEGVKSGELFVWNKMAFEMFYGSSERANIYAKTINSAQKALGDKVNVYNMIVPTHIEMGLPVRLRNVEGGAETNSQADYIKTAYKALNKKVRYINAYNALSAHCNEYIYFGSDHHWTGLGAYYAYQAFAEENKMPALPLKDCTENTIDGFTGTFKRMVYEDIDNDTVHYWTLPYEVSDTVTNGNGVTNTYDGPYYRYAGSGDYSYGVFLYGDNPLEVLKSSSDKAKNKKIAIVHESYGNAIVPYFTYNYKTVYSIDFRSWSGNLKDFCKENGVDDVLFVNGVMSSATALQIQAMESIL